MPMRWGGWRLVNSARNLGSSPVVAALDPWIALDGRLNAPGGTPQAPHLLDTYHPVGVPDGRYRWPSNAALNVVNGGYEQPQWMVAGVDYPVGPNQSLTLISPFTIGTTLTADLISKGASFAAGQLSFGSGASNKTISGYDFSLSGNITNSVIIDNCSNVTFEDVIFKNAAAVAQVVGVGNVTNLTFRRFKIDGGSQGGATDTAGAIDANGQGDFLLEYGWLVNCWAESVRYNNSNVNSVASTFMMRFCYTDTAGIGGPPTGGTVHGDWVQCYNTGNQSGTPTIALNRADFLYDTWRQIDVSGNGTDASQGIGIGAANNTQNRVQNGSVIRNTFLALQTKSTTEWVQIDQSNIVNTINVAGNYGDSTGINSAVWVDNFPQPSNTGAANHGAYSTTSDSHLGPYNANNYYMKDDAGHSAVAGAVVPPPVAN